MKKAILSTAAAGMFILQFAVPAMASVGVEEALCPLDALGDAKAEEFGLVLAKGKDLSDAQSAQVGEAVNACAKKSKWSKADSKLALDFSVTMITVLKLEDLLTDAGVDTTDIKSVVQDQTPEVLIATVDNPDDSPLIGTAIDKLIAQLGDENVTDEIAGYVGAYIVMGAQAHLTVAALVDDEDKP